MDYTENPDCPPDRIYFLDPTQLERSDLSELPVEEIIAAQGDINYMLSLMHAHQVPRVRSGMERSIGFTLRAPQQKEGEE